jgi:hypothetical protein
MPMLADTRRLSVTTAKRLDIWKLSVAHEKQTRRIQDQ